MEVACVLSKLKKAVEKTEKITTKKASLSVLECILLEAKDNTLFVRATNLDIGMEVTIPVKVKKTGRVAVPADIFSRYLSNLPEDGSITLKTNNNTLFVTSKQTDSEIKTQENDEFPSIPSVENGTEVAVSAPDMIDGFRSVWYAASPSSMKPELSSVYVYDKDSTLNFVATDSFRLAEKKITNVNLDTFSPILVPHENVSEIIRVFSDTEGDLSLSIGENQLTISNKNIYISSRLIAGTFPDYQQIIPDTNQLEALVSTEEFVNTLRMADIFSDKFNQLTINANPDKDTLEFVTSNTDVGENTSVISAQITGDAVSVRFNHRYITDTFQSINDDTIKLSLSADNPMIMRGEQDKNFKYLVMPMSK